MLCGLKLQTLVIVTGPPVICSRSAGLGWPGQLASTPHGLSSSSCLAQLRSAVQGKARLEVSRGPGSELAHQHFSHTLWTQGSHRGGEMGLRPRGKSSIGQSREQQGAGTRQPSIYLAALELASAEPVVASSWRGECSLDPEFCGPVRVGSIVMEEKWSSV